MIWEELIRYSKEIGIKDEDTVFIRFKTESESRAGVTNVISELCVETYNPDYEIKTIFTQQY